MTARDFVNDLPSFASHDNASYDAGMKEDSGKPAWDGGDRIKSAREGKDMTQVELGQAIGVGQSAVAQWERGRNPPPAFAVAKLAEVFDCSESWISYGTGEAPSFLSEAVSGDRNSRTVPKPDVHLSEIIPLDHQPVIKNLPLYAAVKGSYDGEFIDMSNAIGVVDRPSFLGGATEAFAIVVVSDSMEPRYFHGETLFVNPRLPVRRGDFVVVEIIGHRGIVKRLLKINDNEVILEQYNPPEKRTFKRSEVINICRVVGSGPPQ